jgi:membrane-associated protease RseP (regulator of RpoE activity)
MNETLLYILGIVLLLAGVGFSIGWHELGHLIPAKLFGVRVMQYMIGFGPTLFSKKVGETEYGVKLIPLGGYISMIGMFLPAKANVREPKPWQTKGLIGFFRSMIADARPNLDSMSAEEAKRQFHRLNPLKRMIIMFGGPFMNLILGFVLLAIALSGIGVYGASNQVQEVIQCVPVSGTAQECSPGAEVSPAKQAGLKAGDRVIAVNAQSVTTWPEAKALILESKTATQTLTISRDQQTLDLKITPKILAEPVLDAEGNVRIQAGPFIGISLTNEIIHLPVSEVAKLSGQNVTGVFAMLSNLPADIAKAANTTISGQERSAEGPISIVGLSNLAGEVAAAPNADITAKIANGLLMLASLNFALFAFNMIPLLPLDGGHIASAIYESIKRGAFRLLGKKDPGPADTALLVPVTWFVFILLFALSIVLIAADLVNPVSLGL